MNRSSRATTRMAHPVVANMVENREGFQRRLEIQSWIPKLQVQGRSLNLNVEL